MTSIPLTTSDVLAGLAFILSAYATWKTVQYNDRQKSLIESQERLNRRLLEKEESESIDDRKANLGATFVKLGSSKYRLKIWNKGKSLARNVHIDFPEGGDFVIRSDVDGKFPLELLEPYQSVELIAAIHMGSKSKHAVKLSWADDFSSSNEKVTYATI